MEITKNKPIVIGSYEGVDFHYLINSNNRFMLNAADIANYLKIDLSEYLQRDLTKIYIDQLLHRKPTLTKYKVNDKEVESIFGSNNTLEDVILIEDGIYYLHEFLIYDISKPFLEFYFWIDDVSIETKFKLLNR